MWPTVNPALDHFIAHLCSGLELNQITSNSSGATIVTYKVYQVNAPYIGLTGCRVGLSTVLLSNLDHMYGPKYLKECFPYSTLLNSGNEISMGY